MLLNAGVKVADVVAQKEITAQVTWDKLEQKDVSLSQRVRYANRHKNAVLVSIHSNAIGNSLSGPSLPARGFMAFTTIGKTNSDIVAQSIIDEFKKANIFRVREDLSDKDGDYERDFYMVKQTSMPSVLTENGFFTNIDDARILNSNDGIKKIAKAHFDGLIKFLK